MILNFPPLLFLHPTLRHFLPLPLLHLASSSSPLYAISFLLLLLSDLFIKRLLGFSLNTTSHFTIFSVDLLFFFTASHAISSSSGLSKDYWISLSLQLPISFCSMLISLFSVHSLYSSSSSSGLSKDSWISLSFQLPISPCLVFIHYILFLLRVYQKIIEFLSYYNFPFHFVHCSFEYNDPNGYESFGI